MSPNQCSMVWIWGSLYVNGVIGKINPTLDQVWQGYEILDNENINNLDLNQTAILEFEIFEEVLYFRNFKYGMYI